MGRPEQPFSPRSQARDSVAFVACLLGAVVPLAALGFAVQRYVVPEASGSTLHGLIGLLVLIGLFSLGSIFLFRRASGQSLERLDDENRRLELLLDASHALAEAPYGGEVLRSATDLAVRIADATAAFLFARTEKEGPLTLAESAGEGAAELHSSLEAALDEMVELATSSECPVLRDGADPGWKATPSHPVAVAAVPLPETEAMDAVLVVVHRSGRPTFDASYLKGLSSLAAIMSVAYHNAEARDAQKSFFAHVTEILIRTLDTHMDLQAGHSRRVAHFSGLLAREMGFDEHRLERLHFASLLHDIGMLRIDPDPTQDRAVYRKHPSLGFRMLKPIRLWDDIAPMVLHHHEWFNGKGYPDGIAGEEIPLESRIIALAEAFDSMTSTKSYRAPVSLEEAVRRVKKASGTQFDPDVVACFLKLVHRGDIKVGGGS